VSNHKDLTTCLNRLVILQKLFNLLTAVEKVMVWLTNPTFTVIIHGGIEYVLVFGFHPLFDSVQVNFICQYIQHPIVAVKLFRIVDNFDPCFINSLFDELFELLDGYRDISGGVYNFFENGLQSQS